MSSTTTAFLQDLMVEVSERAEADEVTLPTAFTSWGIGLLEDAGVFDEGVAVAFRRTGVQLDGFAFDEQGTVLTLIVADHRSQLSVETLPVADVRAMVKRCAAFFAKSAAGYRSELEESSRAFDAALEIEQTKEDIQQVRIVVLSDRAIRSTVTSPTLPGVTVSVDLWDVERLQRLASSGRRQESIRVDLVEDLGTTWPCLEAGSSADGYDVYLCLIPGQDLASIYDEYGPRLLELNVRSFLQARGKVNKGIRDTIIGEPERFLAYNNGITATAGKVRVIEDGDGRPAIAELHELQIVNGGQTSASLHRAMAKDRADLSKVRVMAKITVMPDPDALAEFVPLVSRFSNSQNKVSEADFNANDDFHVQLEKQSRSIWAPAADGGTELTRWFYERARGQYNDEVGRQGTPARRKAFRAQHPSGQKFTKTDVAKFVHTWDMLPMEVSKGAQKNFLLFQERLKDASPAVDEAYFRHLVAKAIMFRSAEKVVSGLKQGGYRANVVTYSLALVNKWSENRVDLDTIWKQQAIPEVLEEAIARTARRVFELISDPPGGRNVTEYAKRPECWSAAQTRIKQDILPNEFWPALAATRQDTGMAAVMITASQRNRTVADQLMSLPPAVFFAAEVFGKGFLKPLDANALQNAAFAAGGKGKLTQRDAQRGDQAMKALVRQGFDNEDLGPYRRA